MMRRKDNTRSGKKTERQSGGSFQGTDDPKDAGDHLTGECGRDISSLPEEEDQGNGDIKSIGVHHMRQKAESAAVRVFSILAILLFATLVYYSLSVTGQNPNPATRDEHIVMETEIIWEQIVLCAVAFAVLLPLGRLFSRKELHDSLVLLIVCILSVGFGIFWVATTATVPDGDQAVLISIAADCNAGEYSAFGRMGYMTQCPHQLGLLTLLRIFQVVFGERNYQSFQYFNVCCIPLIICSGYFITGYLTRRIGAQRWYLCLVLCCFPMYGYLPFVYGEISSTALILFSAWMFLACLNRFGWAKALLCGLSMGAAIALRRNTLIVSIAFLIVLLIKLLAKVTRERIYLLLCLAAGCLLIQGGLGFSYRNIRSGDYAAQPNLLYIVMGLNDDNGYPGWSNWYNFNTYAEFDGDAEAIVAKAKEDLNMYRQMYRNDKAYRNNFFTRKMNAQWQAPLYQCLVMNSCILPEVREPGQIAKWIYYGRGLALVTRFMKLYQTLLYICILFLLLKKGKRDISIEWHVLLVGVFGSFLFSLMWEAKPRYIFPSLLMMLPYYAAGMQVILEYIRKAVDSFRLKRAIPQVAKFKHD